VRLLHGTSYKEVANAIVAGISASDFELLKGNIEHLSDLERWVDVLHGDIDPPDLGKDERLLVKQAGPIAQTLDWSAEPWRALTQQLKESSGKKGRELFHPLRLALTGLDSGPEMAPLVAAMGKDRVVQRLEAAAHR
jgi:glutamyl-tRNA synthetase